MVGGFFTLRPTSWGFLRRVTIERHSYKQNLSQVMWGIFHTSCVSTIALRGIRLFIESLEECASIVVFFCTI